jgi:hypothetical protein
MTIKDFATNHEKNGIFCMKIKFREHRGGFVVSMKTTQTFSSISEMNATIKGSNIEYYCFDARIPAETFVVKNPIIGVLGFMWFEEDSEA